MGNVNLPTPVALAGGAICVLGGYLLGVVAGPDTPERTTGIVTSYDASNQELCLEGDTLEEQEGVADDGTLCGFWRRTEGSSSTPEPGDEFRFVSLVTNSPDEPVEDEVGPVTLIYGDVVE